MLCSCTQTPRRREFGIGAAEVLISLFVIGMITVAAYKIVIGSSHTQAMGNSLVDSQQGARAALELMLTDLRETGYGVDAEQVPPIETASEFRVTFVIDADADGTVEPGERISYFLDDDATDPLVADTDNPSDYVLRRVRSTALDTAATPASGTGDVIAYGITQRSPGSHSWDVPMFAFFADDGTSLVGGAADPAGSEYGMTVPDSLLGKPAGSGASTLVRSIQVSLVSEAAQVNPNNREYVQTRVSGTIRPRNLALGRYAFAGAQAVPGGGGGGGGEGGGGEGEGEGGGDSPPEELPEEPPLPPQEPPIRIPTERVLSMTVVDLHEQDSAEGSGVTVDHVHDWDIVVGTQTGALNNLSVWFEGLPDRYGGGYLFDTVPNYSGFSNRDIHDLRWSHLDGASEYPDVVAAVSVTESSGGFEVWLNQGAVQEGSLGVGFPTTSANAMYSASSGKGNAVAVRDMDHDGDDDVVLGTRIGSNDGRIEVWSNNGSGVFTHVRTLTAEGEVNDLEVADFDGDGWLDIVAGTRTHSNNRVGKLEIWRHHDGSYVRTGSWTTGKVNALAVAHMNDDVYPDVVAGTRTGNGRGDVELWLNDGSGALSKEDDTEADDEVLCVALGAMDPGEELDIVVGTASRTVQVWFCDRDAPSSSDIIPSEESWADANVGGTVNAVSIRKMEVSRDAPNDDVLNDIVLGTAVDQNSGEIVIYLNPYVWTLQTP